MGVWGTFLAVGIGGGGASWGDYGPPASLQSGGLRDVMLIYGGKDRWQPEEFLPYVAYLDRKGRPRDWFYNAFLLMMYGGAPSGQTYIDGATDQVDWQFFLEELFAPGRELAALDTTVETVARQLRTAPPKVVVLVMIPYPSRQQKNFGDVDGDGMPEDLSAEEDRKQAVAWFLQTFLERWQRQSYRHLKLWGFYWMNEGISEEDEAIVKATAAEVHRRGYRFHWIPYFDAPGMEKWRKLGFDVVVMQPNYAFIAPCGDLRIPDEDRLTVAANRCRRLGMGIEIELNEGLFTDPAYRFNLQRYLDHGDETLDGYQRGAVRAYYQGTDTVARLCRSSEPALRRLYDDLYRFHKGTYRSCRPYQPLSPPRQVGGRGSSVACLVDGRWNTWLAARAKAVEWSKGPAALTFDLQGQRWVGDVRVHFTHSSQGGVGLPAQVKLSLSPEAQGQAWEEVASLELLTGHPENGGGFAILRCPPRLARRLRLDFQPRLHRPVTVDEILLLPTPHLLWGVPYQSCPAAKDPAHSLTDGIMGGQAPVQWSQSRVRLRFDLSEGWFAESLEVHFRRVKDHRLAPRIQVRGGPSLQVRSFQALLRQGEAGAWATVPLHCPLQWLDLTLEDPLAETIAVDEVVLLPALNLARGCPYTLDPPLEAKYPDTGGRKLTDGQVTVEGFGDGKTVGWAQWAGVSVVTVVVDTGDIRPLEAVEVHLQGGGYGAVHFPSHTAVAVSEEGQRWTQVALSQAEPTEVESRSMGDQRCALGWLRVPLEGLRGRYVKLLFWPQGWLMLSEVRVLSGGHNVALNQPYLLHPQPTSEGKYPDNSGKLTDGFYSRPQGAWQDWVGFDQADPVVTVDLGGRRCLRGGRIHLLGGGGGGIWFPAEMAMFLSDEGQSWMAAGTTTAHPPETGKAMVTGFMEVYFLPQEARFVRFCLKRRGWAMLDEVEVIPPPRSEDTKAANPSAFTEDLFRGPDLSGPGPGGDPFPAAGPLSTQSCAGALNHAPGLEPWSGW